MNNQRSNRAISLVLLLGVIGILGVNAQEDGPPEVLGPVGEPVESSGPVFDENAVVTSHTQQFRISGGTSADRGAVANLAESMKSQFLSLTGEKDEWSVPITIRMVGERGDPVGLRSTVLKLRYNDSGYEVDVFVSLSRGLEKLEFQRSLISALVFERALRDKGKEHLEVPLSVPPWFTEGLLESISWTLKETDRRLYEALFTHGGLYQMDDLFAVSAADFVRIDSASEAAFRVSSGALVMALLEQPKGKEGMRKILAELPAFEGETPALLRRHFPELNLSQRSLEKWWSLQLANKGSAPLTEVIGVIKTDERLTEALMLRYRDPEGEVQDVSVEDWSSLVEMEPALRRNAVSMAQQDLVSLSYRCFPSYRPLLKEYQDLLNRWATGETEGVSESFEELAERRHNMVAKAQRARDFLDWFEITRAREISGVFEDYLKLKAQLKTHGDSKKDPISEYLDRMDTLFTPEGE